MTDASGQRAELSEIARKLVLRINEITPAQWDGRDQRARAIILAALQATRQEALREAKVIITQAATWTPQSVVAILDRLAREGVK